MASNAFSGVGTQFLRGDGTSNEAFVPVAEVKNISGPDMSRDFIDVTSLDSTGGYREFIPGFRDAGQVVLSMNYTLDAFDELKADFDSELKRNYQIIFGDITATQYDFTALVTALSHSVPFDDAVSVEVTVKISGPVAITS